MSTTFKSTDEIYKTHNIDADSIDLLIESGKFAILSAQRKDELIRQGFYLKTELEEKIAKAISGKDEAIKLYCIAMRFGYQLAQKVLNVINENNNKEPMELKTYFESNNINNITMGNYVLNNDDKNFFDDIARQIGV